MPTLNIISSFDAPDSNYNNSTGYAPTSSVTEDAQGNLFGTASTGGVNGTGTVYELIKASDGTYAFTTLFSFDAAQGNRPNTTGAKPYAGLTIDAQGNLFGSTSEGGTNGNGTVYELVKGSQGTYTFSSLFSFDAYDSNYKNASGYAPQGSLITDAQGNIFGVTSSGGTNGTGTVYELIKDSVGRYAATTLLSFDGVDSNGANSTGSAPQAGLIGDAQGNLFGTATNGGTNNTGTVYELVKSPNGRYAATTLLSFAGIDNNNTNSTGAYPSSGLTADAQGNLFGTASSGGMNGAGTVYELIKSLGGTYTSTTLLSFDVLDVNNANATGANPAASLTFDAEGDLFGTASSGGANGTGTVFELVKSSGGTYTLATPLSFAALDSNYANATGASPYAGLSIDGQGNIFGTAQTGGANGTGAVFRILESGIQMPPSPTSSPDQGGPSTTISPGPDLLAGTSGPDTIAGLQGDDTINGGGGNDLILGNQGNDIITDGDGNSTIAGGMDNDRITVGNGSNLLYGNEGLDTIQAGNGGNTIVGGQDSTDGADFITSGSGNDLIFGNGGDDTVGAGGGRDTVVGGFGRDVLLGNQGDDLLLGNQGDDTLYGGQGGDTVIGGQGNDVLYGNQGDDVLYGNEGLNTFVFAPGDTDFRSGVSTGDTVMDFVTGTSRIDFASGPAGTAANFGAASTTATDFASAQAVAQGLINSGDAYAFVSNGTDGYLFTTGGTGTAITDAVKLAGAGTAGAVKFTDIAHGVLA